LLSLQIDPGRVSAVVNVEEVLRHLIRIVGPGLLTALTLKHANGVIPSRIEHTLNEFGLSTALAALAAPDLNCILG
jgi:hypothetical protein